MCLLVVACAWASIKLSEDAGKVSCIWIANGAISAFVLIAPKRWKITFFLAGQLANLGIDLALGDTLGPACWFAFCNAVEVLITVLPLRHFATRAEIANKRALCRIAFFGVFLAPLTGALLAMPAIEILDGRTAFEAIRIWFLADGLGAAASLPFALFLLTSEKRKPRTLAATGADMGWAGLLMAVAIPVFWQTRYPILFLLFPPLVAVLLRFKLAGAIFGTSTIVALAAAFTAEAHGPFSLFASSSATERVMLFQIFGLLLFSTCVPVGFVFEERFRLQGELKDANCKLEDLVLRDALTGVLNRRGFDAILDSEWSTACASGGDLSLLYLDIDFFKLFNDTYGHQQGDECLTRMAGTLVAGVRASFDSVARYGGEEFAIVLPATSADSARITADRIAAMILDLKIPNMESPFGFVTASFGIATVRPSADRNPAWLVHLADDALYTAKREGRNRIETNVLSAREQCVLAKTG